LIQFSCRTSFITQILAMLGYGCRITEINHPAVFVVEDLRFGLGAGLVQEARHGSDKHPSPMSGYSAIGQSLRFFEIVFHTNISGKCDCSVVLPLTFSWPAGFDFRGCGVSPRSLKALPHAPRAAVSWLRRAVGCGLVGCTCRAVSCGIVLYCCGAARLWRSAALSYSESRCASRCLRAVHTSIISSNSTN
jgi:hypothetical protein